MIEVSEEKYNEYLRYCKSVEWMGRNQEKHREPLERCTKEEI